MNQLESTDLVIVITTVAFMLFGTICFCVAAATGYHP